MPLRILPILRPLPFLLLGSLLSADSVSELKGALARLNGQEALKASLEYQVWNRRGDAKKPVITEGRATTLVEDGPQGLRLSWSRGVLQAAAQEARAKSLDPEKRTPTRNALEGLKAVDICEYLNGAGDLLRNLELARLVSEKTEAWQGRPSRLLTFKVVPRMGPQERKYVKDLDATLQVWVGTDGLPLAAESQVHMKGRAFLVIGFEQWQKEQFRFARAGNRLVVVQHVQETSGSGGGETSQSKTVMNLRLN